MKNILKLMLLITFGVFLLSSCEEGDVSMPDVQQGTTKNLQLGEGQDPMIPFLDPASFASSLTLDVITGPKVASIEIFVEFSRMSSGYVDTVLFINQTTFPQTHNLTLQDLANLFPDSSSVILNDLEGGDYFRFFTGDIYFADGTVQMNDYEFIVQGETENDTINPVGYSPAMNDLHATYWLEEYTYYVGCPTDLAGKYIAVSNGTNTDGWPPAVDFTTEVEITATGGLGYTIDKGFGGVYEFWYCAPYGYCFDNAQNFLDICGELSATFKDSWGRSYPIDGSVDETTGVITYHYINAWGDEITTVLTPQ